MMREEQKTSQAFPEWEARFRSAFETAGHGMAIVSLEGRFLEVNKAWLAIVGYSREELWRLDFQSITHPDDLTLHVSHMKALLSDLSHSFAMEKRYIHKD